MDKKFSKLKLDQLQAIVVGVSVAVSVAKQPPVISSRLPMSR
jgi:hypothetical protein